jgi:hypothetical protein
MSESPIGAPEISPRRKPWEIEHSQGQPRQGRKECRLFRPSAFKIRPSVAVRMKTEHS